MKRGMPWVLILLLASLLLAAFVWPGWRRYDYDPDRRSRIDNLTSEVEVWSSHGWKSLGVHRD